MDGEHPFLSRLRHRLSFATLLHPGKRSRTSAPATVCRSTHAFSSIQLTLPCGCRFRNTSHRRLRRSRSAPAPILVVHSVSTRSVRAMRARAGTCAAAQRCGRTERGDRFEETYPQDFPSSPWVVQDQHAVSALRFPQRGEWGSCRMSRQGEPAGWACQRPASWPGSALQSGNPHNPRREP
jgi:hypothetical protein